MTEEIQPKTVCLQWLGLGLGLGERVMVGEDCVVAVAAGLLYRV